MSNSVKKPYSLEAKASTSGAPSGLYKPYDLTVIYDRTANGGNQYIFTRGYEATSFALSTIYQTQFISPVGVDSDNSYGTTKVYNLKQFAPLQGREQSSYGNAYLQGGVRWVTTRSIAPLGVGKPALLNTTANQSAYPSGIARTTVVPAPTITPHMIYARGIYGTAFGAAKVIPTPVLRQKGVNHFEAGKTTVWFHTRPLDINSFESYATGYPDVFDPAQFIQQLPFNRTAVFGDTYAKNVWTFVKGAGAIDGQAISDWATLENKNRSYGAKGFLSQAFGDQLIKNKSPSIFFHGLPAPIFYSQAIGYRVRAVAPTGFDRLELGKPTVIKTPELFPRSYVATQFGVQWISNHTRYIENHSKNYGTAGTPTVWFRWRYANPKSWLSQVMGDKATFTHGVREVIASGFIRQAYGNAWVSRSPRLLQPTSIYKEYPSNHYVGRHQEIQPAGYIATLFGERIIPEIQAVYPLGFTGVFGLAFADLSTKHIKAQGYLSAGEQPAFRWGRQIVYNSDQYVMQEFIGDSGLVPPKWSEWTAIENRNKTVSTIGSLMQRFGYAQIDNNARLIEPQGLIATQFDKSMIAYRVRHLPLQGIEAPYMSDWLAIYNGARVIKPVGEVQSLFGNAEAVKTRRYFDRIGRIDSFESGTAMIAYRIRTLDIEKRYSIAPPIIRLPTVDLHTRYIEFRGYETAKYGLASLSIHFRIITPRWSHRDKVGDPMLRNITPELLARGRDSQEYGNTSIRTEWRHVYAQGDDSSAIGLLKISDTKQYLSVRGFIDSLASQKHAVTKTASAPYSTQHLWLHDESGLNGGDGHGIKPPKLSSPAINQNVLYVKSSSISSMFGTQFVWSNNLTVYNGIAIDGVSKNAVVFNMLRAVAAPSIDATIKAGRPTVSPHTVWAVVEASAQARQNHPLPNGSQLHYVGQDYAGTTSSRVGRPFVESSIRTITPYWSRYQVNSVVGRPSLDNSIKIVAPEQFRSARLGVPSIPFTLKTITLRTGFYSGALGLNAVTRPPYTGPQDITAIGFVATRFAISKVDNFIRNAYLKGFNSQSMGLSKHNDTPYMWQGLRIGEHIPMYISAGETLLMGNTNITLKVRELSAQGFNAFTSQYELESFDDRIRVYNQNGYDDDSRTIDTKGFDALSTVAIPDIRFGQRYIRPDGNSNQFRKGGYHA